MAPAVTAAAAGSAPAVTPGSDRDACVIDMHAEAFGRLGDHVAEAVGAAGPQWEDRAVAVVQALLGAWEADRVLAQLCLISSVNGHGETLKLRRAAIEQIAELLADPPKARLVQASVLNAAIVGIWGLAFTRLTEDPDKPLDDLAGPAISILLAPFVGRRQAAARADRRGGFAEGAPTQRDRLVAAMGELVAEAGPAAIGVYHVCQRAGVSRRTFYELYVDREACLLDMFGVAQDRLVGCVAEAVVAVGAEWEDRAVAAARALVGTLCADRVLGYLCVVAPSGAGRDALVLQRATIDEIGRLLGEPPPIAVPTDVVLAAALGGVLEMLGRRLFDADPEAAQGDLAGAAIYTLLAPFIGRRRAVTRAGVLSDTTVFVARWTPSDAGADHQAGLLITELTRLTLEYLREHPGATNIAVARAVDVRHESQMSRHLARLQREGVVQRRKEGRTNAWRLTPRGEEAARSLRDLRSDGPRLTGSWAVAGQEQS
jgi:AcrR family transcriptional regulator